MAVQALQVLRDDLTAMTNKRDEAEDRALAEKKDRVSTLYYIQKII
jgi:hypothetical protein